MGAGLGEVLRQAPIKPQALFPDLTALVAMLDYTLDALVTVFAQRLPPSTIPEHRHVALVRHNVVNDRRWPDEPVRAAAAAKRMLFQKPAPRPNPPAVVSARCCRSAPPIRLLAMDPLGLVAVRHPNGPQRPRHPRHYRPRKSKWAGETIVRRPTSPPYIIRDLYALEFPRRQRYSAAIAAASVSHGSIGSPTSVTRQRLSLFSTTSRSRR